MDKCVLLILSCIILSTAAWSPYYSYHRRPLRPLMRVARFARPPPYQFRVPFRPPQPQPQLESSEREWSRPKRDHDDFDHNHHSHGSSGVTGPVHTFVKTDKNANYKWGVRHHVGNKFASR